MRRKAGKESSGVIDQPCLVVYGTAIPTHYYAALSERMLTNGFFARMLIVESGPRSVGQEPGIINPPPRVLETARWWSEFCPGTGNLERFHPLPRIVEADADARVLLTEARQASEAEYASAEASQRHHHGHGQQADRQCAAESRRCEAEIRRLSAVRAKPKTVERLAELHDQLRALKGRLRDLQAAEPDAPLFDPDGIEALFADFDAVWGQLTPREQAELVSLLVARVEYDGAEGAVAVSFHETGIGFTMSQKGAA